MCGRGLISETWLLPIVRRELPTLIPPTGWQLSYLVFCFLILPVWDNFFFCLHSSYAKFSAFDLFPSILECFASLFLLSSVRGGRPIPPTHTLKNKDTKTGILECKEKDQKSKISHVKNVNKRKNRLILVKLESKKQDDRPAGGFVREVPIQC